MAAVAHVVTVLAACTASAPDLLPEAAPSRPDVVLVSIDTLRPDHLHAYGYARTTSPTIDALAAEGTRFAHARSPAPWTLPSHATLLTGLLPSEHRVVEDGLSLGPDVPRLAQEFGAHGYHTGGFVTALYVSRLYGFDRGFERFEDFGIESMEENLAQEVDAGEVVDAALTWVASLPPQEPVFLFLHFYDVHYEYDPPGHYATLFDRAPARKDPRYRTYHYFQKHPLTDPQRAHQEAQYDEAIRYVDDQLARLREAFGTRTPIVAITSDHGEEIGERGSWGHAHTLYAEQLRVPLVVAGPGVAAQTVEAVVGTEDLAASLPALVGLAPVGRGRDLSDVLRGGAAAPDDRPFVGDTSRFGSNRAAISTGGLRLEWDLAARTRELFDERADPQELHDLAALRPADVGRLSRELAEQVGVQWVARTDATVETTGVLLHQGSATARARLEAGTLFRVLPADAEVRTATAGPWAAVGGSAPGPDDPLGLLQESAAPRVELDERARRRLEALGYVQNDE